MPSELEEYSMARSDHDRPIEMPSSRQPTPAKPRAGACDGGAARILSAVLRAVVMAAFLALFLLLAGVAAVLLLLLFATGAALRRRSRLCDSSPPRLSQSNLKAIPCYRYPKSTPAEGFSCDCAVCLEVFRRGERVRVLPGCGHLFHVTCVDRWLLKTPACPVCRHGVGLD